MSKTSIEPRTDHLLIQRQVLDGAARDQTVRQNAPDNILVGHGGHFTRMLVAAVLLSVMTVLTPEKAHAGFNVKRIEARLLSAGHTHIKWVSHSYPYVVDACHRQVRYRLTFNRKRRLKGRNKLGYCRYERLKNEVYGLAERNSDLSTKGASTRQRDFHDSYWDGANRLRNFNDNDDSRYGDRDGASKLNSYNPGDDVEKKTESLEDFENGRYLDNLPRHATMPLPLILKTLRDQGYHNFRVRNSNLPVYAVGACRGRARYLLNVNGWGEIVRVKYRGRCLRLGIFTKSYQFQ